MDASKTCNNKLIYIEIYKGLPTHQRKEPRIYKNTKSKRKENIDFSPHFYFFSHSKNIPMPHIDMKTLRNI